MSWSRITLVAVLLLLLVVFSYGLLSGDSGSSSPQAALVRALKKRFITEGRAAPGDFACACRKGSAFLVRPSRPAEVGVATSQTRVRTAALKLVRGAEAKVRYEPAGSHAVVVQVSLKAGRELELKIFENGGTLKLQCVQPALPENVCELRLY